MSEVVYTWEAYLRDLFTEKEPGRLFWNEREPKWFKWEQDCRAWNKKYANKEAGCEAKSDLRWYVKINAIRYPRYRIIYCLHTGEWVLGLDHKNRHSLDDNFENLRLATGTQNNANCGLIASNTSGYKGVSLTRDGKWQVSINVKCKAIYIGRFDTSEEAYKAYCEVAKHCFGEFACT